MPDSFFIVDQNNVTVGYAITETSVPNPFSVNKSKSTTIFSYKLRSAGKDRLTLKYKNIGCAVKLDGSIK